MEKMGNTSCGAGLPSRSENFSEHPDCAVQDFYQPVLGGVRGQCGTVLCVEPAGAACASHLAMIAPSS